MNTWSDLNRQADIYKSSYPEGTRVILEHMNDSLHPIEPGTRGTVDIVDDIGQIHIRWDNGRFLAVIPGEDSFRKLTEAELAEEAQGQPLTEPKM